MSDISQVTVGGTTYDIKDATARTDKDKVAQYNANVATDNSYYPIAFSYSTSSSDVTTYLKKTNSIYYNPYAKNLKVSGTNSTTGKSHETSVYYDRLKVYDRYFEDPTDVSTLVEECIEITPTDIAFTEGDTWDGTNASLKDSITQLKSNLTDLQKTTFGTKVDLTAGVDYTTQYDGYFIINFNGGDVSGNNYVYGTVNGVRLLSLNSPKTVQTFGYENDSVFVRKGSVLQFTGSNIARGSFLPIVS